MSKDLQEISKPKFTDKAICPKLSCGLAAVAMFLKDSKENVVWCENGHVCVDGKVVKDYKELELE